MAEIKPYDTAYEIPEEPIYDPVIRAIKNSDPVNAEIIVNPLIKQIITNVHAVKLDSDKRAEKPTVTSITLLKSEWKGSTAPYTLNKTISGIVKTNGIESLIYAVPFSNTVETGNGNSCSAISIRSKKQKSQTESSNSSMSIVTGLRRLSWL